MAEFFSKEWADTVRDALPAGPDEQARAVKLQEYWDFFDFLKTIYPASWALGCRDRGSYLFVQWSGGTVTDCRIIGPDDPCRRPTCSAWTTGTGRRCTTGTTRRARAGTPRSCSSRAPLLLPVCPRAGPGGGRNERSTCSASASGCHGPVPTIRTTGSGLLYSDTS